MVADLRGTADSPSVVADLLVFVPAAAAMLISLAMFLWSLVTPPASMGRSAARTVLTGLRRGRKRTWRRRSLGERLKAERAHVTAWSKGRQMKGLGDVDSHHQNGRSPVVVLRFRHEVEYTEMNMRVERLIKMETRYDRMYERALDRKMKRKRTRAGASSVGSKVGLTSPHPFACCVVGVERGLGVQ